MLRALPQHVPQAGHNRPQPQAHTGRGSGARHVVSDQGYTHRSPRPPAPAASAAAAGSRRRRSTYAARAVPGPQVTTPSRSRRWGTHEAKARRTLIVSLSKNATAAAPRLGAPREICRSCRESSAWPLGRLGAAKIDERVRPDESPGALRPRLTHTDEFPGRLRLRRMSPRKTHICFALLCFALLCFDNSGTTSEVFPVRIALYESAIQ